MADAAGSGGIATGSGSGTGSGDTGTVDSSTGALGGGWGTSEGWVCFPVLTNGGMSSGLIGLPALACLRRSFKVLRPRENLEQCILSH